MPLEYLISSGNTQEDFPKKTAAGVIRISFGPDTTESDIDACAAAGCRPLMTALLLMLITGICVAANNKINLYLSGVMDSAVFFPTVNGGGLILATLTALVLFREKPTKKQWLGIAFGTVSVVLLCNPF